MKYVPRDLGESAENSSGGGGRGLAREIATLAVLTICALGLLYLVAGWLTDFAVARISPEKEAAFFSDLFAKEFSGEVPDSVQDKWAQAESILNKLKSATGVLPLEYQLGYLANPEPNAFAVPGGRIVLTQGLLSSLDEEISIAFVLAHELGHFAGRDHLQRLGRVIGLNAGLSILTGGSGSGMVESAGKLLILNYSRREETEADRFALHVLDEIYGTREGADRLFVLLNQSDELPEWAYMFSSHPDTAKRIEEIRQENREDVKP